MNNKSLFHHDILLRSAREWLVYFSQQESGKLFCLIDKNVEQLYQVSTWSDIPCFILEADENEKSIETAVKCWESMCANHVDRQSHIIAIGGGITTDIAGFVASIYMRGVSLTHIPTTLLAMIDASIGGKTGLNLLHWKNRIGTFYSADRIVIDREFLESLADSEWRNGWAEAVKHALIHSDELTEQILNAKTLANSKKILTLPLLEKLMKVKLSCVSEDPFDHHLRQKLNAGHTAGHALESFFLKKGVIIDHGLAVAAGLWMETEIAFQEEMLNMKKKTLLQHYLMDYFDLPQITEDEVYLIFDRMKGDKKNQNQQIHFSLIRDWGHVCINRTPDHMTIKDAIRSYCNAMENS